MKATKHGIERSCLGRVSTTSGHLRVTLVTNPVISLERGNDYDKRDIAVVIFDTSCNNVAPVTNLCLGRATTRSHSSQWSKIKVAVKT